MSRTILIKDKSVNNITSKLSKESFLNTLDVKVPTSRSSNIADQSHSVQQPSGAVALPLIGGGSIQNKNSQALNTIATLGGDSDSLMSNSFDNRHPKHSPTVPTYSKFPQDYYQATKGPSGFLPIDSIKANRARYPAKIALRSKDIFLNQQFS